MMKKRSIILLAWIFSSFLIVLTGCSGKATLDFQEIADVDFSGLNGNGSISFEFDESIYEDGAFLEKLYPDDTTAEAELKFIELLTNVDYTFSKEEDLSNGDEVTVTVEYDEDKFEERGIKVKNPEFTVTVEGLSDGTKIDVFDGLEVTYSGLSGKGYVIFDTSACDAFTQSYVYFEYPESKLSNGDTITVTANYNSDDAEENLVIIENDTKEYTVSGLKEPEEIDPFENLEITYTGASPYITASIDSTRCNSLVNNYISFSVDNGYLRNGDTFTVTASYSEYDAEEYGFIVTNEAKTYTVENQPEYVTSLDGLDLTELQAELDDKLTVTTTANEGDSYFADVRSEYHYPGFQSVAEKKYKTAYLVSLKTNFEDKFDRHSYNYNRYMKIYEYLVNYGDGKQEKVYVIVYVNNIQKNADGTISWDIELGSKGYTNYDSLVNDFATSEKEFYNVSEVKTQE